MLPEKPAWCAHCTEERTDLHPAKWINQRIVWLCDACLSSGRPWLDVAGESSEQQLAWGDLVGRP